MGNFRQHAHCSYCGHPFAPDQPWPRQCAFCGHISFLNPLPVAVLLVPVAGEGLILIRRGIEPQRGLLALPGGFMEVGESWQEAAARETFEEAGLMIDPEQIKEFRVRSTPDGKLMVFGLAPALPSAGLPPFAPTPEATERVIASRPQPLAFPLHTEAMQAYFELMANGQSGP